MGRPRSLKTKRHLVLRPATAADADLLLDWRNDPDTVRFSRSGRPVTEVEHAAWLADGLTTSARRTWIGQVGSEPVGQVRVDASARGWEVALIVAPSHRGKGLSRLILEGLLEAAPELGAGGTLWADVKADNPRSIRAFESVGFHRAAMDDGLLSFYWTW